MIQLPRELCSRVLPWDETNYVLGVGEHLVRNHVLHKKINAETDFDLFDDRKEYDFKVGNIVTYINSHGLSNGASERLCEVLGLDGCEQYIQVAPPSVESGCAPLTSEEKRELSRLRSEIEKWPLKMKAAVLAGVHAGTASIPVTKPSIQAYWTANDLPFVNVTDSTLDEVWAILPNKSKGGRLKKDATKTPETSPRPTLGMFPPVFYRIIRPNWVSTVRQHGIQEDTQCHPQFFVNRKSSAAPA